MPMKPTSGGPTVKIPGGAMFPGLTFKPGQGVGTPFVGRRRLPSNSLRGRFQPPKIYGRIEQLEVQLARKKSGIRRAQRLRYKVFYEEMSATPDALAMLSRRDEDVYDPICDHLLVLDHGDPAKKKGRWRRPRVVRASHPSEARPSLHRARPVLRAEALSKPANARTAVARRLVVCARA